MEYMAAAVHEFIEDRAEHNTLAREHIAYMQAYADVFQAIPFVDALPDFVHHRFLLKDVNMTIARWQYSCPKKYQEAWKALLQGHLDSGRMCPFSSPYTSPAFLVPKGDSAALPWWVNDYW